MASQNMGGMLTITIPFTTYDGGDVSPPSPPLATPLKTSPVERSLEDVLNVAAIFLDITPQSALPFIDAAHHKSH